MRLIPYLIMLSPRQFVNIVVPSLLAVIVVLIYGLNFQPHLGFQLGGNDYPLTVIKTHPYIPVPGLQVGDELVAIVAENGSKMEWNKTLVLPINLEPRLYFSSIRDYHPLQADLHKLLQQSNLQLQLSDGRYLKYVPLQYSFSNYPFSFWLILVFGFFAWIMSLLVWAWYPRRGEAVCLMLNGLGFLFLTIPSAVHQLEYIVLSPLFNWGLHYVFVFGHCVFLVFGLGVLIYFPKPLKQAKKLVRILFVLGVFLYLLCLLSKWDWSKSTAEQFLYVADKELYLTILLAFVIAIVLCLLQWNNTKQQPLERLQTYWVTLAWLLGPVVYLIFYLLPMYFNQQPWLDRVWAWAVVFCSYWMLLLVIGNFKLIQMERHFRIAWLWVVSSFLVVLVDLFMVMAIQLDERVSLTLILLTVLWVYFPLRYFLYQRQGRKRIRHYNQIYSETMMTLMNHSVFRVNTVEEVWQTLLIRTFNPVSLDKFDYQKSTQIEGRGQSLSVSAGEGFSAFVLTHADNGNRLFNTDDADLITSLQMLFERMVEFQNAFVAGQSQERNRIRRDLHDQVGHSLLSLIYAAKDDPSRRNAQKTLDQLRDVIRSLREESINLESLVFEIRNLAQEFCNNAGVSLNWEEDLANLEVQLQPQCYLSMLNIIRELLSNAVRHGHADSITVQISSNAQKLGIFVADNGAGFNREHISLGLGLSNINSRVQELGGKIIWSQKEGTQVTITIPCNLQETLC